MGTTWLMGCHSHFFQLHSLTSSSAAAAAKSLQSCPTRCDPIDSSPPGSLIPEILQARTLEWVAISFSNAWKWKVKVKSLSCVWLFETPLTAAHQAPPSMGFFQARVLVTKTMVDSNHKNRNEIIKMLYSYLNSVDLRMLPITDSHDKTV